MVKIRIKQNKTLLDTPDMSCPVMYLMCRLFLRAYV